MSERHDDSTSSAMDDASVSMLLRAGLAQNERRPIDDLILRLEMDDGAVWCAAALQAPAAPGQRPDETPACEVLARRDASIDALRAVKDAGRRGFVDGAGEPTRLRALLHYFLAIAAALDRHDAMITGQAATDVAAALADLAEALPEPWAALALAAAMQAAGRPPDADASQDVG